MVTDFFKLKQMTKKKAINHDNKFKKLPAHTHIHTRAHIHAQTYTLTHAHTGTKALHVYKVLDCFWLDVDSLRDHRRCKSAFLNV